MIPVLDGQRASHRPQHLEDAQADRGPVRRARARPGAEYDSEEGNSVRVIPTSSPQVHCGFWEPREDVQDLPPGKRQVMEKFFTPLHAPSHEETKHREQHQHYSHYPRQYHHYQHEDKKTNRYTVLGGGGGNVDQGHNSRHWQGNYDSEHHPHHQRQRHSLDASSQASHSQPYPQAPSYTSASSSSSSSSSWSSQASIDKEMFLMDRRPGPKHSQSCTNISSGRHGWGDGEEEEQEEEEEEEVERGAFKGRGREPPLRHNSRGDAHHGQPSISKLQRGHSKSEERLLHNDDPEAFRQRGHGPLYKTVSLGRSLAFSDSTEVLLGSGRPRKAVSSVQLPSKGILKNKQGQGAETGAAGNFRKAKSMEVLSTRVEWMDGGPMGGGAEASKPSKPESKDLEKKKEVARQTFVQEKLQFSAFLNEITRQVISPSRLSSLGVTDVQESTSTGPGSPKSPKGPKGEQKGKGKRQEEGPLLRQHRHQPDSPESVVLSVRSHPDKPSHYSKTHHGSRDGTPQSQRHAPGSHTEASTSPENSPFQGPGQAHREGKRHKGVPSSLLTDSTSTSPELNLHHLRHQHPQMHHRVHHSPSLTSQPPCQGSPKSHKDTLPGTPESESHCSKSDSSRKRDSVSTASPSSEHNDRVKQVGHRGSTAQPKDAVFDVDVIQLLQERNEELQRSLLQTVVRMECMEVQLQATREELGCLREKFRRLQDNYSATQETNHLLGQKLHSVHTARSVDEERESLIQRISQLTAQLATARTTIFSLETINVPSLLQELLEKHFHSEDSLKQFLLCATPPSQAQDTDQNDKVNVTRGDQSYVAVPEDEDSDWSVHGEELLRCGKREPGGDQQRVTAFLPWKQDRVRWPRPERGQTGGGDAENELVDEEPSRRQPTRPLQIPHLQITTHPETSPLLTTQVGTSDFRKLGTSPQTEGCRVTLGQPHSPIRILSTSLDEIHSTGGQHRASPRCTGGLQGLDEIHSTGGQRRAGPRCAGGLHGQEEDRVVRSWRMRNSRGRSGATGDGLEQGAAAMTYRSAQKMLDDFMRELQPPEEGGGDRGGGEFRGWVGRPTEEVLNGERTQL